MRAERLRRTKDIDLVRAAGEQRADRHFTLRARSNGLASIRVAVASPRTVGTAVRRSRARRRVREAIRLDLAERAHVSGTDLFVVTRMAALSVPAPALREAVHRHLDAVLGDRTPGAQTEELGPRSSTGPEGGLCPTEGPTR